MVAVEEGYEVSPSRPSDDIRATCPYYKKPTGSQIITGDVVAWLKQNGV